MLGAAVCICRKVLSKPVFQEEMVAAIDLILWNLNVKTRRAKTIKLIIFIFTA